jgi:hypothetical protein
MSEEVWKFLELSRRVKWLVISYLCWLGGTPSQPALLLLPERRAGDRGNGAERRQGERGAASVGGRAKSVPPQATES